MTHLITQPNPAVKKAVVPSVNLTLNGPYYPSPEPQISYFNKYVGGVGIAATFTGSEPPPGRKIVKITLKKGDLLDRISNIYMVLTDNTLLSVTGYAGVKLTKTLFKPMPGSYIYTAFPIGGSSLKITKDTTITFTFKNAIGLLFPPTLVGPSPTLDKKTGFYWYGSDKTVLFGPQKKDLTKLTIPPTTKIIVQYAFSDCTKLTGNLTIPGSVTYIGERAFYECGFTGNLTIPNSVTYIGDGAFTRCTKLTGNLTIGNGLKTIVDGAFSGCGFTGNLTIPDSVTSIGESAFRGCGFKGNLKIGNKVKTIGDGAFSGCNFGGTLILGSSLTSIPANAFSGLFTGPLTIPNSVKSIGASAFEQCNFTGPLTIPVGVTSIGTRAFYSCEKLDGALTIANTNIKLTGDAIFRFNDSLTGSVSVYRANMTGDPFDALPGVSVTYLG